ncbi:MAG: hypothetical protein J5J06_18870 [Phycisphaerae bacterium]|nr:hypothetical protein [Phycisphaerae bacterium]
MNARTSKRSWFIPAGLLLLSGCQTGINPNAAEALRRDLGNTTVTVFPAYWRGPETYDDASAAKIAEFLNATDLAKATASDRHVPITGPWRHNQARMLRTSAKEFGEYVRTHPIGTSYALLPEYLGGKTEAVGIHAYIVDAKGAVAFQVLLNSHWAEFSKARPVTSDDCTAVLIDVLRERLKPETGSTP